jgi:hypothetical protein
MDDPVSDGAVVLLREGDRYGAFILTSQNQSPETVGYQWYYRPDGQGRFTETDGNVQTGSGSGPPISFGSFTVQWSIHTANSGWLYYPKTPGDEISDADFRICVTDESDISQVDACDPKWTYKASPIDPGIPGGRVAK